MNIRTKIIEGAARVLMVTSLVMTFGCSPKTATQDITPEFKFASKDGYIYGIGIVAMYRYYSGMAHAEGGLNKLVLGRSFLKPGDKPGSGPNVDTYYSYGWFDLSEEPMVVSLPAFGDRYYVYQLTDIYAHNFHNVGNGLYGKTPDAYSGPYAFVIIPPGWSGEIPDGLDQVESTGKLVNVLYRIRVTDEAKEAEEVHRLQDQSLALPLSEWTKGTRRSVQKKPENPLAPMEEVLTFKDGATGKDQRHPKFFEQLAKVLRYDPPSSDAEKAFVGEILSKVGFSKDGRFVFSALSEAQQAAVLDGQEAGYDAVQAFIPNRGEKVGTATFTSGKAGNYGDNWLLRSGMVLAGAMYPTTEVSRYADTFIDSTGESLTGEKSYTMTFAKDQFPPVTSFWSLTMYSLGTYDLVANPIDRYKIGPETPGLVFGDDGSLTITISHEKPQDPTASANWLPAPEGRFYAMVRFYAPTETVLNLEYKVPPLIEVKN